MDPLTNLAHKTMQWLPPSRPMLVIQQRNQLQWRTLRPPVPLARPPSARLLLAQTRSPHMRGRRARASLPSGRTVRARAWTHTRTHTHTHTHVCILHSGCATYTLEHSLPLPASSTHTHTHTHTQVKRPPVLRAAMAVPKTCACDVPRGRAVFSTNCSLLLMCAMYSQMESTQKRPPRCKEPVRVRQAVQ